jgi:hypothetical protein
MLGNAYASYLFFASFLAQMTGFGLEISSSKPFSLSFFGGVLISFSRVLSNLVSQGMS